MIRAKLSCAFFSGILFFSGISTSFEEGSIDIFSLNNEITPTEDVLVTGFVSTNSFFKPVKLEVYDPNGELVFNPTINFNEDGHFSWLFHPPLGKYSVTGTYEIIASHEDVSETDKIQFTVVKAKEDTAVPVLVTQYSKQESGVNLVGFFDSLKLTPDEPKIKDQEINVKTSNSKITEIKSNENVEFLESTELVYIIPLTIAVLAGIVVIRIRVIGNKKDQNKKQFGF